MVGHYTFYSKSVVKRPKNYILVEDIFAQGYVGGENTKFFKKEEFARRAAAGDLGKGGLASCIAVAIPKGSCPEEHVLDITGRFAPSIYDTFQDNSDRISEHYPASGDVYDLLQMDRIDMYKSTNEYEFMTLVKRVNTVCWRGMELNEAGKPVQLNTGHWGANVYPGVKAIREGQNAFMKDMNWADKMSLV